MNPQSKLLEVVTATHTPSRFPGRLYCRQQETHKHADDGDDDQQFHQGETSSTKPLNSHANFLLEKSEIRSTTRGLPRRCDFLEGDDATTSEIASTAFFWGGSVLVSTDSVGVTSVPFRRAERPRSIRVALFARIWHQRRFLQRVREPWLALAYQNPLGRCPYGRLLGRCRESTMIGFE